jgi:glycosyltransferase involved in cell wall biosynthesis
MRILAVFNHYQQRGGEAQVFEAETALLEAQGHFVERFQMHNDDVDGMNRLTLAAKLIWNKHAAAQVYRAVRDNRIDIVHFHNTFPLISPSAYYAAHRGGARVVHTLHNFRLVCPGALLSREGRVCEECLGRSIPWRGIQHACYRDSRLHSAAVTTMLATHRLLGTWQRQIDTYIALSEFAKTKFIEGGVPHEKIVVKPNFVDPDPGFGEGSGGYAFFAGRLVESKGIRTLLAAWKTLGLHITLRIAGEGPLADEVKSVAISTHGIEYLGPRTRSEILQLMKDAVFLVFPSLWYEGFPVTLAEAYACGLPVIASDLGTMKALVKDDVTGLRFHPGSSDGLTDAVRCLLGSPPDRSAQLRKNARREYLENYSAAANYEKLMKIYDRTLNTSPRVPAYAAA